MKKHLFFGLAGVLALSACSSDEPIVEPGAEGGNGVQTEAGTHYLAVNIVSTPSNGKAGGDQTPGDPNNNATYEEGYASENQVNKVRFYFFDVNGNAADVCHDNGGANFYDWKATDAGNDMPNVEKVLEATIVISTPEGHELPSRMMAVINPDEEGLGNESLSVSELRARTRDYVATATGTDGAFVMTNSVYAAGTTEMAWSDVTSDFYCDSEAAALAKPVNIYVERNVAKVRVTFGDSFAENKQADGTYLIPLKDAKGNAILVGGQQVYFKANGWNVTAAAKNGYLSKHIDSSWSSTLFGNGEPWNWGPYFRSYWAINTFATTDWEANLTWDSYNNIGARKFDGSLANSIYVNENAPQLTAENGVEPFTKAIIAGEICDENGNPVEVCIYAGARMAGRDALKTALLAQLQQNGMIYKRTVNGTDVTYTSLTAADVTFITALEAAAEGVTGSETTTGRYVVYMQLTDEAKAAQWSYSNADNQDASELISGDDANAYLKGKFANVQIYNEGKTYYYFPIEHLGAEGNVGQYGVVRNHIYACAINTIAGLGTPVYDPDQTIYPEKPENEETYIAAKINILSWRVVNSNVDLNW